jgi:putative tryptophan/tyrosine transport system substrate-binding protein
VDRRAFIGTIAGGFLTAPLAVEAQQAGKVYRIGLVSGGSAAVPDLLRLSEDSLRALGYIEGQNLVVERRYAEGKLDELPRLVTELLQARVDLILTVGTPAARSAQQATATIPIIFSLAADPVAAGLVATMARPGGNLTGFAQGIYTLKQVEVLKQAVPRLSRAAYLHDSNYSPIAPSLFDPLQRIGVSVEVFGIKTPDDFDGAFKLASKASIMGVVVENSPMFYGHFQRIARLGVEFRLPTIGHTPQFAEAGGFLAYGANTGQANVAFAAVLDKILKGTKPADVPVWQVTKFDLSINLKTAKALGLTVPPSLLQRADQVIE